MPARPVRIGLRQQAIGHLRRGAADQNQPKPTAFDNGPFGGLQDSITGRFRDRLRILAGGPGQGRGSGRALLVGLDDALDERVSDHILCIEEGESDAVNFVQDIDSLTKP